MYCHDGWCQGSVTARGDKKSNYECRGGTRECRGAKTGKGELDQIRQMIRAISQSRERFGQRKVLFPPCTVRGRGSVRGQEYDL